MTTKLTLSVDEEVVKDVKRFAKEQGVSVSAMFESYARSLTRGKRRKRPTGRLTLKASGFLKLPRKKSERQVLEDALVEKYGL